MNKDYFSTLLFLFFLQMTNAQVFWTDDFQTGSPSSGMRSASAHVNTTDGSGPGICGLSDYFFRTNLAVDAPNGLTATFSAFEGTHYWRGEDLDGCIANPDVIDFTGIDISGRTGLTFQGLFGCRTVTTFETTDEIRVEYQIDGGGYSTGIVFEPNAFNSTLAQDTDNDGTGDIDLTEALAEFSFTVAGTGTTLDLRITCNADGGGEEFAFDFFRMSEVALPVELTSFTVKQHKNYTLLNWQTASELNNNYFQIEHSRDGRSFNHLDKVIGNGTSSEINNYSFLHTNPSPDINYYRLKQVDFDGAFEYSKIISINYRIEDDEISVFPNPFEQSITVVIPTEQVSSSSRINRVIEIFDVHQRLVHSLSISKEESNIIVDLSMLSKGIYFLTLNDNRNNLVQRIIKL